MNNINTNITPIKYKGNSCKAGNSFPSIWVKKIGGERIQEQSQYGGKKYKQN